MANKIFVGHNGSWKEPKKIWVGKDGEWQELNKFWGGYNGNWVSFSNFGFPEFKLFTMDINSTRRIDPSTLEEEDNTSGFPDTEIVIGEDDEGTPIIYAGTGDFDFALVIYDIFEDGFTGNLATGIDESPNRVDWGGGYFWLVTSGDGYVYKFEFDRDEDDNPDLNEVLQEQIAGNDPIFSVIYHNGFVYVLTSFDFDLRKLDPDDLSEIDHKSNSGGLYLAQGPGSTFYLGGTDGTIKKFDEDLGEIAEISNTADDAPITRIGYDENKDKVYCVSNLGMVTEVDGDLSEELNTADDFGGDDKAEDLVVAPDGYIYVVGSDENNESKIIKYGEGLTIEDESSGGDIGTEPLRRIVYAIVPEE